MSEAPLLKLRALDMEDLAAMAAAVEGALVRMGEMAFEPKRHRFALALERAGGRPAGLHFEGVLKVASRGLEVTDPSRTAEIRGLGCEPGPDGAATVFIAFAGGASVRLEVECLEAYLAELPPAGEAR